MVKHLLFEFHGTRYALAAEAVQTTFWLPELSPVEDLPPYFVGLINLHGRVIPIVDLGLRFGHPPRGYRFDQSVVLLKRGARQVGIIADTVLDLVDIAPAALEPFPHLEGATPHHGLQVIAGTVKWESAVLILLDPDALLQLMFQGDDEAWGHGEPGVETPFNAGAGAGSGASRFIDLDPAQSDRLRRRTQQLAQALDEAEDPGQEYALVTIGNGRYAIELERVAEFTHLTTATPLPCCPPHILGGMNLRGAILTLLDLAPLLQGQPRRDYRAVVILWLGDQRLGLAVHQVLDVRAYPAQAATALGGQAFGHPHCKRLLHDELGVAGVLDLEALRHQGLLDVNDPV